MANSPPTLKAMAGNAFIKVRLRGVTRRQRWQYASDRMSFIVAPSNHARRVQLHTSLTGFPGGNEFHGRLDQIHRFCRKFRSRASKVRLLRFADTRILTKYGEKEMPSV
jgi:hypothetical protein